MQRLSWGENLAHSLGIDLAIARPQRGTEYDQVYHGWLRFTRPLEAHSLRDRHR